MLYSTYGAAPSALSFQSATRPQEEKHTPGHLNCPECLRVRQTLLSSITADLSFAEATEHYLKLRSVAATPGAISASYIRPNTEQDYRQKLGAAAPPFLRRDDTRRDPLVSHEVLQSGTRRWRPTFHSQASTTGAAASVSPEAQTSEPRAAPGQETQAYGRLLDNSGPGVLRIPAGGGVRRRARARARAATTLARCLPLESALRSDPLVVDCVVRHAYVNERAAWAAARQCQSAATPGHGEQRNPGSFHHGTVCASVRA